MYEFIHDLRLNISSAIIGVILRQASYLFYTSCHSPQKGLVYKKILIEPFLTGRLFMFY